MLNAGAAGWALASCATFSRAGDVVINPTLPDRIDSIQSRLDALLPARLTQLDVPGFSIAIADGGQGVWAKGYGVKSAGAPDPITAGTLFQAASISKPITALSTLRLVDAGVLDLDVPVNNYLKSWKLPPSALVTDKPVTLRRILSHTSGLGVHGFYGYEVGAPLPTLPQILDGAPPANSPPVRAILPPGTKTEYSGGAVCIEQLLVMDVTGAPFAEHMARTVLGPLQMKDSGYFQPLIPSLTNRAATAHDEHGAPIPGRWHVYPELAAAGLWTTPSDLLLYVKGVQAAVAGRPGALISRKLAREMVTPQLAGDPGAFGLGPRLSHGTFRHAGDNAGFHCTVAGLIDGDLGWAAMTNGERGIAILKDIRPIIADALGWAA